MPVVTLQSLKMIGRLEVGKLGRGPQILLVLNVFMRQMEPHVKWHISGGKLYFRFLMFQNGSKNQYLGFQQISRKSVKVEFLTYHVARPLIELKLAFSKTCSDSFNMGRVCSVLMPVVTLQSFKMIGCLKVG